MIFILFTIFFVSITVLFAAIGLLIRKRRLWVVDRLEKFLPYSSTMIVTDEPKKEGMPKQKIGAQILSVMSKMIEGRSFVLRFERELEQSGVPLKAEEFVIVKVVSGIGFSSLIALGLEWGGWIALLMLWVGYMIPNIELKRRKEKRLQRCLTQLPPALGSMATSLRAGFSFMQALQMISKEIPDPLGPEFARTLREINFGVSVDDALKRLTERLPNPDLEMVLMAMLIQRSTGGNLAEILESIQETIQERVRMKEESRTLTAQGRASAWVITILPIALAVFLYGTNHDYFTPMLTHPIGWGFILYGLVSGAIGWIVIQKMMKIEV
ncbi:type II secretion system F family protein [Ammoniphilus sp. CFH 90114]|uniref:type II secretion system F family protein n=1 Tax=Ammoniphilus sp. CFH 90114 TaxID=2493665 RepID=UPI0013E91E46|nr:type II secretion system F family protein [Ammoniphilus sp. CFH 90114]